VALWQVTYARNLELIQNRSKDWTPKQCQAMKHHLVGLWKNVIKVYAEFSCSLPDKRGGKNKLKPVDFTAALAARVRVTLFSLLFNCSQA